MSNPYEGVDCENAWPEANRNYDSIAADNAELRARVTALEGTVATLRERLEIAQDILRDRCDHGHRCPKNEASQNLWATPDIIDAVPCTCGLTAALEKSS